MRGWCRITLGFRRGGVAREGGVFGGAASDVMAEERGERESVETLAVAMFEPAALDFGDVVAGVPVEMVLTFSNTTNRTLNFYSATGPYPDTGDTTGFDISGARACRNLTIYPIALDPGGKCTMVINFTPRAIGVVTATLTFYEYGSTEGYSVPLRGNGVPATPASTLTVAAASGPYRGEVALSATLAGCTGALTDRTVSLTITTAAGSRTVGATTNASGVATATVVPLSILAGGVVGAIPAGEYTPSTGLGISASFAGGEGCAAASGTAALIVERRTPTLTFATPAATTYGAAPFALTVGSSASDDAAAPPLHLEYAPMGVCTGPGSPSATVTILGAGDCTITLSQPAGDNVNYAAATPIAHTVTIARATPDLAWAAPSAITYGTPLGSAQLRASATFGGATLPGAYAYTPGDGSVLTAGPHLLAVTFTPTDTANYAGAQTSVSLTVNRATPAVTWAIPTAIGYGTPLGAAQLGASATVAGGFVYSQPTGAILGAGAHDLTVLFTPTDGDNYTTATGGTTLTIERATLTVTANPASRAYGADEPAFAAGYAGFVNGEGASVLTGSLVCMGDATRLSPVGAGYRITCSGLAATNYTFDYRPGALAITQATSTLIVTDAETIWGAATLDAAAILTAPGPLAANAATFTILRGEQSLQSVAATGINGSAVSGTLSLTGLTAGDYTLVARYAGDQNVAASEGRARLRIAKATQAITFTAPAELPLAGGAVSLVASADSGLTVAFSVGPDAPCTVAGALLTPLRAGACTVTATQDGDANYQAAQGVSQIIQITAPPPTSTATATGTTTVTATAITTATTTATATGTATATPTGTATATMTATTTVTPIPTPPTNTPIATGTATATSTATPPTPTAPTSTPIASVTATPPINTPVPSGTPSAAQYTLALTASAGGSVSASAPGPRYTAGTRLTLRATPVGDAIFVGWTVDGVAQGWSPTLIVVLRADRRVEARFAARPAFGDFAGDVRAADPIAQLAARGIIKGYGDGSYGPADPILRAQMAALIVRALGWDGAAGGPVPFDDRDGVDAELWRAIGQLATRGVARGYGDGTYRPRDPVLHLQAVSFVTRALVAAGAWRLQPDDPRLFTDVPASSGHRVDLVTYAHYVGALPGFAPGALWPGPDGWEGPATRAWFAELLWRALDLLGREEREV